MTALTLTEFLLARIAEDEESTRTASTPFYREMFNGWHRGEVGGAFIGFTDRFTPDRVLAECEAKRRVVGLHHATFDGDCARCDTGTWTENDDSSEVYYSQPEAYPCETLRTLALPYADHPDYRQEWKP